MAGTAELSEAQLKETTESLQAATRRLDESRAKMDECQSQIKAALDRQTVLEKSNTDGGTERDVLRKQLASLAASVQSIANEHTSLLEQTRKQSLVLARGNSGEAGASGPFMWHGETSKGSVFASRRQAVELGYYIMATMSKSTPQRQYARGWLKQNAADLVYLPNIPSSFVQQLGIDFAKVCQQCLRQGSSYATQDLATNATPGSVLVFPSFADTFIRNVEEYGVFRRNALVWPMGANEVFIPRRVSGFGFQWVGEAAAASEVNPTWDLLKLTCKKGLMLHQYSSELAEDENAAIALADLLMFEFALTQAYEEDRIGFTGTGTGGNESASGFAGFIGVLGIAAQASTTAKASIDINKAFSVTAGSGLDRTDEITLPLLRKMIGGLPTVARKNAKWYAHRTVVQDIFGIETTGGGPITSSDASGRAKLLGYPIEEVEVMPVSPGTASTPSVALGDLRKAWILGDRRQPELETSEHYAFNTDQLTLRFGSRFGFLPVWPNAMVQLIAAA